MFVLKSIGLSWRTNAGRGRAPLDVMVTSVEERNEWRLTDLLGRSVGLIRTTEVGDFLVEPEGKAQAAITGMRCGPFGSLDDALAAIETHTRGACRRESGST